MQGRSKESSHNFELTMDGLIRLNYRYPPSRHTKQILACDCVLFPSFSTYFLLLLYILCTFWQSCNFSEEMSTDRRLCLWLKYQNNQWELLSIPAAPNSN